MKTKKKITLVEVVYVEYMPEVLEERKLYISERFELAIHNCMCGCGIKTVTPLGEDGWRLIKFANGTVSLTPSIGNQQLPCKSHYILTKNVANFV